MKKLLLTLTVVVASAAMMYGQGRIGFDNVSSGNAVTVGAQNQGASGGDSGNFVGANYSIQLVWAPQGTYATQALFDLAAAGVGGGSSAALPFFGVTGAAPGHGPTADGAGLYDAGAVPVAAGSYTVQARAWFNTGFATFALASAAQRNTGLSTLMDIVSTAPPTPPNFTAFPSFALTAIVPEPSTFALAGLGAASLLLFRRRK